MSEPTDAQRPLLPEEDRARAEQNSLRCKLLNGLWNEPLEQALEKHIRKERREAWGIAEMSRNPFRSLSTQIGGALYRSAPLVRPLTKRGDPLVKAVEGAGFWQIQQRASTDLVGLREGLIRVDWSERGGLLHRPVPIECVHIESLPTSPDVPSLYEEIQKRIDPETNKMAWCWEQLDIRDLENPVHKFMSADRKRSWKISDGYQYREKDGKPFMPAPMYHAERTGNLWDSYYGLEAVLGTLTIGVLLTFWVHGVKDGSFATVVVVGGKVQGLTVEKPGGAKTQIINTEPGAIIEVAGAEDGTIQPQIVQLQPGFDPEKLMNAIGLFESGLAEYAGVSAADLVRTGADPRSGASLSISREGLRGAQARFEPQLRRGDLEVLEVSAKILNRATGTNYPETGYTIEYPSLPLSESEIKGQREDILEKVDAGLMSVVDGYMRLHPGVDRKQAVEDLRRIKAENEEFAPAPKLPAPGAFGDPNRPKPPVT